MKKTPRFLPSVATITLLAVCAAFLTGCVVSSVYPFYTKKDLTFDPALVGVWTDAGNTNSNDTWTFAKSDDQSYTLTMSEGGKTNAYEAHLFRLKGQLFLDFLPKASDDCKGDFIPPHYLMRVASMQPELQFHMLDYKWLGELLKAKPKTLRHMETDGDNNFILTADTAELQRFITRHLKTKDAWSTDVTALKRK